MVYLDETEEDFQETRKIHLREAFTPLQVASNGLVEACEPYPAVSAQLEDLLVHLNEILREGADE